MESVEPAVAPKDPRAGRLLSRRVRELFRVYPKALVGEVEAVHDLRVAARRLRAALGLLALDPEGKRARRADKTLRDLARAAGRGRDLDVGMQILEAMPAAASEDNVRLRRALSAARSRARFLSREALLDIDLAHLRRDLRALVAATRVDRPVLALRLDAFRLREEEIIARELDGGSSRPKPEQLHGARRAARRLRYAAEVEALFDGAGSDAADRWRKMQSRLGDIQDRHVLSAWLSARESRATAQGDLTLSAATARALSLVNRDAARLTREFATARKAHGPSGSGLPSPETPTAAR
jgi:CHAD domain-containing protein